MTSKPDGSHWSIALPQQLTATPHRALFFGGAIAIVLSMLWWIGQMAAWRFGWLWPAPPIAAPIAHATLTQFGMLPMFAFGFLLTVFPRWMDQAPVPRTRYVLVFASLLSGYVCAHAGLLGIPWLLRLGLAATLTGWSIGLATLAGIARLTGWADRHALSCLLAVLIGLICVATLLATTFRAPVTLQPHLSRIGTFGFLLPLYFTVCHRMLPFFSKLAVRGYDVVRPSWSLPFLWPLLALHIWLDGFGFPHLRWLADIPLAAFFLWHALAWQPWKAVRPGLLAVLHLAFAWLPCSFTLFSLQSLGLMLTSTPMLGKAPVHALTIGFFSSMLIAMATRVTAGHSGRPLEMGVVPWFAFITIQFVTMLRIAAEFADDRTAWMIIAAGGWLVAFTPWVMRAMWIYSTPRADGHPG